MGHDALIEPVRNHLSCPVNVAHHDANRAAELGHVQVVEALLDYGCDPKLAECNGRQVYLQYEQSGIHLFGHVGGRQYHQDPGYP